MSLLCGLGCFSRRKSSRSEPVVLEPSETKQLVSPPNKAVGAVVYSESEQFRAAAEAKKLVPPRKVVVAPYDVYLESKKFRAATEARFRASFSSLQAAETINDNIPSWMYDAQQTLDRLRGWRGNEESIKAIDAEWTKRQCVISTPQGTAVMRFCPSKQSFEYFCNSTLNMEMLDACAMIYSMRFCCRDLCLADHLRPEGRPSPIPAVDLSEQIEETGFLFNFENVVMEEYLRVDRKFQMEEKRKRAMEAKKKEQNKPPTVQKRTNRYRRVDRICGVWDPSPPRERPVTVFPDALIRTSNSAHQKLFQSCKPMAMSKKAEINFDTFYERIEKSKERPEEKEQLKSEPKCGCACCDGCECERKWESESESDSKWDEATNCTYTADQPVARKTAGIKFESFFNKAVRFTDSRERKQTQEEYEQESNEHYIRRDLEIPCD